MANNQNNTSSAATPRRPRLTECSIAALMLMSEDRHTQSICLRRQIIEDARSAEERQTFLETMRSYLSLLTKKDVEERLAQAHKNFHVVVTVKNLVEEVCTDPRYTEGERSSLLSLVREAARSDARRGKQGMEAVDKANAGASAFVDSLIRRASPPPKRPRPAGGTATDRFRNRFGGAATLRVAHR